MHTEDEAKTKWCPHVRYGAPDDSPSANRWLVDGGPKLVPSVCLCIASGCMAWRWTATDSIAEARIEQARGDFRPFHEIQASIEGRQAERRTGYCGMSGRP